MDPYVLPDWKAIMAFFKDMEQTGYHDPPIRGYYTRDRKMMDMLGYDFERGWERERDLEMQEIINANAKIVPMLYDLMREQKDAEVRKRANLVISGIRRKTKWQK